MRGVWVVAAALVLTGCASQPHQASIKGSTATRTQVAEPPLVGTEWQLASYQTGPDAASVTVTTDSTMEYNGKGAFHAHACNYIGADVVITPTTLTYGGGGSTDMACGGEAGQIEQQVDATTRGSVTYMIHGGALTLTNANGHELTYRVRPFLYPTLNAQTITTGERHGGLFRLAVTRASNGTMGLVFETRSAPGEPWGTGGVAAPAAGDCLADEVLGVGRLGDETFLAAWATPNVAKVTTQASKNAPETPLTFFAVPGSTLRIASIWTSTFRPSASPVTFYRSDGSVIAAYPRGPC